MRRLLPILVIAVLMSACGKPDKDLPIHFSILGDSYSTFQGYLEPDTNEYWQHYAEIGVTGVEQMWWFQVADSMDWVMERNNSYSGSLICNFQEFDGGDHYGPNSFLRRLDNLGNPNVIFIFGGTNDMWQNAPFGDYEFSNWNEEQLCAFRPALACLFYNIKRLYPYAHLYFLLETDPCPGGITEEARQCLVESSHRIASHYGVDVIDLTIHKDWWHPDAEGQADIARQVLEVIGMDFNA